ncbi:MAG: response regulator transcription factor [Anaerolineaceae bacterium]|nr:response regulator transcription factor [Anaerolineaceae bacterium]
MQSQLSAERLVLDVNAGQWSPPEPYDTYQMSSKANGSEDDLFQALQIGRMVVVVSRKSMKQVKIDEMDSSNKAVNLSRRQMEVLQALAEGMTTKQIAYHFGLSERTIAMHVANLKERLDTHTRAETVAKATLLGMCVPGVRGDHLQGVSC